MSAAGASAFWSYAHEDDRLGQGRILSLARAISDEYSLLTGGSLDLFVDRDLRWGEEWREVIDGAISSAKFFIPVLTARYFQRPECRREFLEFHQSAEMLGVAELILPVMYAPIPSFGPDNADELISLASRYQYADWSQLRLKDVTSEASMTGVHNLVMRLVEAQEQNRKNQLMSERAEIELARSDDDRAIELIERIEAALPAWLEVLEEDASLLVQHTALAQYHGNRIAKLARSATPSSRFAQSQRFAADELPLAIRQVELAKRFLAATLEIDKPLRNLILLARSNPIIAGYAETLRQHFAHAFDRIDKNSEESIKWERMEVYADRNTYVSRTWTQVKEFYTEGHRMTDEANQIISSWRVQIGGLESEGQ